MSMRACYWRALGAILIMLANQGTLVGALRVGVLRYVAFLRRTASIAASVVMPIGPNHGRNAVRQEKASRNETTLEHERNDSAPIERVRSDQ